LLIIVVAGIRYPPRHRRASGGTESVRSIVTKICAYHTIRVS